MKLTVIKEYLPEGAYDDITKADRSRYIGGSEAGAVVGMNPFKSKYTLFCEKCGFIDGHVEDNDAMRTGRDLEAYVAKRFWRRDRQRR